MKPPGTVITKRQRWPFRWAALSTSTAVAILLVSAVICGLHYWEAGRWYALAITVGCCIGLGVAGVLLQTDGRGRKCGIMLVATGAAWSLTWSQSWDVSVFPVVGQFAQSFTFLLVGIALAGFALVLEHRELIAFRRGGGE